jgi:hypothetical protein
MIRFSGTPRRHAILFLNSLLACMQLLPFATANARDSTRATDQLIGSWRLVSRITTQPDGKIVRDPGLATTPSGILVYDRSGHVAAQLSREGRTVEMIVDECATAAKVKGTNDTAQTILGYDAYFGTYTVDEKAGIVTHHLQSALFPGDIGKSITRHFAISGNQLTITFNTSTPDGTPITRTLTWARML